MDRPGVAGVDVGRERPQVGRRDQERPDLEDSRTEQVLLPAGREPGVRGQRDARRRAVGQPEFRAQQHVADARGAPRLAAPLLDIRRDGDATGVRVGAGAELVNRLEDGVRSRRQAVDHEIALRLERDVGERQREAEVEPIRNAVGRDERRDVARNFHPQLCLDDVPFEEERNAAVGPVEVLVLKRHLQRAVVQIDVVDPSKVKWLKFNPRLNRPLPIVSARSA